jgi:hypothetical protein
MWECVWYSYILTVSHAWLHFCDIRHYKIERYTYFCTPIHLFVYSLQKMLLLWAKSVLDSLPSHKFARPPCWCCSFLKRKHYDIGLSSNSELSCKVSWDSITCFEIWSGAFGRFSQNLRKATVSFVLSVCPSAWNKSVPTGRICMKLDIWILFQNMSG